MVRPVQIPVTDSSAGRASALLEIQGAWFQNPSLVRHYFCHHIRVLIQIRFSSQFDVREDEEQNVKLGQTIDLLLAAGYFRARIKGLSPFDKVCINVLQHNDIHSLMYIIHVPVIRDCMCISD